MRDAALLAYGRCPMGCGAVAGRVTADLEPCTDRRAAGWPAGQRPYVRLGLHLFAARPALGQCIGSRQYALALPLAAPASAQALAAQREIEDAAQELTLFDVPAT